MDTKKPKELPWEITYKNRQIYKHDDRSTISEPLCNVRNAETNHVKN